MSSPLCHFELMTKNPEACKAFYGAVFGWQFDDDSMPGYSLVDTGAEPTGGIFKKPDDAPGPCMNVYFHSSDITGTIARAVEAGGRVIVEETEIPNVGRFAMIADPEGIVVGLFRNASG